MDDNEVVELASDGWRWSVMIPLTRVPSDLTRASDRVMRALTDAGFTYQGGPVEISVVRADQSGIAVAINSDADPSPLLAELTTLPLTVDEETLAQRWHRLQAFLDAKEAGTNITVAQMATVLADVVRMMKIVTHDNEQP